MLKAMIEKIEKMAGPKVYDKRPVPTAGSASRPISQSHAWCMARRETGAGAARLR